MAINRKEEKNDDYQHNNKIIIKIPSQFLLKNTIRRIIIKYIKFQNYQMKQWI